MKHNEAARTLRIDWDLNFLRAIGAASNVIELALEYFSLDK